MYHRSFHLFYWPKPIIFEELPKFTTIKMNAILKQTIFSTFWLKKHRKKITLTSTILLLILAYYFCLPAQLFDSPYCTIVEDKQGELMGAHISKDGQWRFPPVDSVPKKFEKALLNFEDKRFFYHWGVDILSVIRAIKQNFKARKTVSGGSTLTMQVIRMSRGNRERTFFQKIIEMIQATRLEFRLSKHEILKTYSSHVSYGGNVVGLEAASWRYFGRKPSQLSWAESAMLAVLPNSPAIIHPGRNRGPLLVKRNKLLKKLFLKGIISNEEYQLAIDEPIPLQPKAFPRFAPHLLARLENEFPVNKEKARYKTSLDYQLQLKAIDVIRKHLPSLQGNKIYNAAALVVEVETGHVLAYIGNADYPDSAGYQKDVDVIMANRSSGSILKPLLYAAMLSSGDITPNSLVPDIPTTFGGYSPQNYNLGYDGAIPASKALARSLNVPAVRMLQKYGTARFHNLLQKIGLTSVTKQPEHYGLSLILGGCESKLWDLAGIYSSMARTLNHFHQYNGRYNKADFAPAVFLNKENQKKETKFEDLNESSQLSAASIWFTFEAMLDVERPEEEMNWSSFASSRRIAWKTGTSFGFRDAWAVGIDPRYVVAVWAGNATGEGRPELIGVKAAAPIMFDIFRHLPSSPKWFEMPLDEMVKVPVCLQSGDLASENCETADSTWIPAKSVLSTVCQYHKTIHLDKTEKWRVTSDCEPTGNMVHKKWFILPPAIEWFYKIKNPNYKVLPPYRKDCATAMAGNELKHIEMIYPQNKTSLFIPLELDGSRGKTVFKAAHRRAGATIFWHIDNTFIGQTIDIHQMAFNPDKGWHTLTLVDEFGEKCSSSFEIMDKPSKSKPKSP
jgi:penicillin-binding protein 1C